MMSTPTPTTATPTPSRPFGSYNLILKTLAKGKFPHLAGNSLSSVIKLERELATSGARLTDAHKNIMAVHSDIEKSLGQALAKANDAQDRDLMAQHSKISKDYTDFRGSIQESDATYQQLKNKYAEAISTLQAVRKAPADAANLLQVSQQSVKNIANDILDYAKKSRLLESNIIKFSDENIARVFAQHGIRPDIKSRPDLPQTPQIS
ncbi:MAG: hypothetical protein WAW86_04085 [Gammaproteobacteria bacterium]